MLSAAGEAFLFFGTEQRGCILGLDRRGRAWLTTRVPSPQDRSGLERCRQRTLDCAKRPISGSSLCPLGLSPVESSGTVPGCARRNVEDPARTKAEISKVIPSCLILIVLLIRVQGALQCKCS